MSDLVDNQGITEEALTSIMGDVMQTMTGSSVTGPVPLPDNIASPLTAAIYFVGPWQGAVLFQSPPELCYLLTSRMLQMPLPEEVNDDVRDAMGEMCNMVAGNLKSVMLHRCELSLPSIVQGNDYSMRVCGQTVIARWCYLVEDWPCVITVLQLDKTAEADRHAH